MVNTLYFVFAELSGWCSEFDLFFYAIFVRSPLDLAGFEEFYIRFYLFSHRI